MLSKESGVCVGPIHIPRDLSLGRARTRRRSSEVIGMSGFRWQCEREGDREREGKEVKRPDGIVAKMSSRSRMEKV